MEYPPLLTFLQFSERYPWPSKSGLQSYYYRRKEKGLEKAFVKFGKRVLVIPEVFFNIINKDGE